MKNYAVTVVYQEDGTGELLHTLLTMEAEDENEALVLALNEYREETIGYSIVSFVVLELEFKN